MAKKKYEPEDLYDFIETEAHIECSNCPVVEDGYDLDEEQLFEDGWRATKTKVYCPECAKKKLKLQ